MNDGTIQYGNAGWGGAIQERAPNVVMAFLANVGGMNTIQHYSWWNQGGGLELNARLLEDKGFKALTPPGGVNMLPPEVFMQTNKPINSLADLKGLKIRTAGIGGIVLEKMGASTVFLPGGEVYESMQRGVIDAFEYSTVYTNWSQGFHEVADYLILSGVRAPMEFNPFGVSTEAWNALPDDLKILVEDIMRAETMRAYQEAILMDIEAMVNFKDYGTTIMKLPAAVNAELIRVANEYYDEQAAKDPFFAEVIESKRAWKAVVKEYDDLSAW